MLNRYMKLLAVALLLITCGCATSHRIGDQEFRDYLNFKDICENENNRKPEYCQEQWEQFMAAKAKLPAPQQTSYYSETTFSNAPAYDAVDEEIRILEGREK